MSSAANVLSKPDMCFLSGNFADLFLCFSFVKNGRRLLSMAAQEVTQDLWIAANVKKKQVLLVSPSCICTDESLSLKYNVLLL